MEWFWSFVWWTYQHYFYTNVGLPQASNYMNESLKVRWSWLNIATIPCLAQTLCYLYSSVITDQRLFCIACKAACFSCSSIFSFCVSVQSLCMPLSDFNLSALSLSLTLMWPTRLTGQRGQLLNYLYVCLSVCFSLFLSVLLEYAFSSKY